jgi:hypothetical protein
MNTDNTTTDFLVTVSGCDAAQAETVMQERITPDEDYGFDYEIGYRSADKIITDARRIITDELRITVSKPDAIPGIRPYPLATVDALIDAYEAFDGHDISVFVDAWNDYTAGLDFPCPEHPAGLHQVTDGSCDLCGDKNRS